MVGRWAPLVAMRALVAVWASTLVGDASAGQTVSEIVHEVRGSATERYRGLRVRDVRLVFEGDVTPEAAFDLVDVAALDTYRPDAVRRSIRQLFALGAFSDIKVEAERVGDDVDVLFRLYPMLQVRSVEIRGLDGQLSSLEGRLVDESRLDAGDPLDVDSLGAAAERIQSILRDEGYLWATVEPEASFRSPSAVVVFHVDPGRQAQIGAIEIRGVPPHVDAHIRRELAVGERSPYSRAELDESVEKLSATWRSLGYYGASIDLTAVRDSDPEQATVALDIDVDMGPRVQIEVEGTDLSDQAIRRLVPLYGETLFTEDLIEESRANLARYERERGHRDVTVTVQRETSADGGQLLLRFQVERGPVYEVESIDIEGLSPLNEPEIRALIVTRTKQRFRSAPYQEQVWRRDLEAVQSYLERQGFHRATVASRESSVGELPGVLVLVAVIDEGPRALIGSIQVEGASAVDSATVLKASALAPGAPFDAARVVEARERIVAHYYDQGFRQVDVQARTTLDDEGVRAAVEFRIGEGQRTRVDRVIVSGLNVTRESSVRELVTVESGEPLSPVAILETRQKLVGSGLFRSVNIEVLPADPMTNRSDVLVSVEEGPRTTFAYGFGFEEQQLLRAEVEVTRRNLFGLNRTVSVFTRASFRGGRFITTYRQPDSIIRNLPLFVSLYAEEEQRTSFSYNRVGVGLQISKRLSEDQNLFFRYRFDNTDVFDLRDVNIGDLDRRFQPVRIGAVSVASVTDQRDDPLNPRSGQFRIMDVEWSATALGTEAPYLKGLAQQFLYWRLPRRMVAAVGVRVGAAHGSAVDTDPDALNSFSVPIAERFFSGGATTLRGFALDQASPLQNVVAVDPDTGEPIVDNGTPLIVKGDPVGGNVISLVNFELRFPIWRNLRGVAFSDNGAVFRDLHEFSFSEWRHNVGFGFRYETPFGPLRVDYGLKLDRRTFRSINCPDPRVPCAESLGRWHVSLGHAF
jgi:outer membrane protein insertion porin family